MNTVILISFDNKVLLDKLKEKEKDSSGGYNIVVKKLLDFYSKSVMLDTYKNKGVEMNG